MFDNIEDRFKIFDSTFQVLEWIGLFFLVLTAIETFWDYFKKTRPNLMESFANAAISVGNVLLERTSYGLVFIVAIFFVEYFIPYQLPLTWWSWVFALLLADITYYWMHRIEHEVRFFWSYHSVHHSSPEYNLTTALRLAWIEGLIEWIFLVPMLLLGFSAPQTIVAIALVVIYQTWIHTEKIGKLGWADKFFNTPSVHRVHHGSNKYCIDKNYGGILIIWDRIFGTYQAEEETVIYGLTKPVGSSNPITINLFEMGEILKDVTQADTFSDVMGYLFKRPGWKPKINKSEKDFKN